MKCTACVLLLLSLASAASAAVAVSVQHSGLRSASGTPVERVVDLLKDLKESLETDEKKEQKIYDKYACWCEKTTARKADAIDAANSQLRALGQEILSLKGKIATLSSEIEQLEADIKDNEKAQAEATALRQKENAAFVAETDETKQAIAALEKAILVLVAGSKPSALLQQRSSAEAGAALALRNVVAAMPVSKTLKPQQVALLDEFLNSDAGAKYTPQSSTVQGMLKDMYETFATDLMVDTAAEATANTNYENFIATKVAELKKMQEIKKEKEDEKAEAESQLADTQQLYDDTTAQKNADIVFFDETKAACQSKHDEWTTRSSLREEEIAGITKALEILTGDDARELFASAIKEGKEVRALDKYDTGRDISFLQLASDAAPAQKAYSMLKAQATEAHSLRLAMLAVQVREAKVGHFDKVIESIDEMIKVLKDEDTADIAKRDQCKDEYQQIASKSANLKWKIKVNEATIDKLTKLIEKLEAEKAQTIEEIDEVNEHMKQLTKVRQDENQAFKNSKKEDQDAIDLLLAARSALSAFYSNHSIAMGPIQGSVKGLAFAQEPVFDISEDQAPDVVFSDKGKRKNESKDVISILTMIIEDLNDEIKNSMKAEEVAQLEYEKQMDAAQKLKDELIAKKDSLTLSIAKRKDERDIELGDKAANELALKDEVDYKASITPDCDWIIGAFEKRSAARVAEMNGLVGAKEYLAGYKPPASEETALLEQGRGKAFDDAALRSLRFLGLGR